MTLSYCGGCACGAIRFESQAEPVFSNHCQCRDCQRESGTGHGSYLTFLRKDMNLSGQTTTWEMVADSGGIKSRHFCAKCGMAVYLSFADMPDFVAIRAGSLDDPAQFKPQVVTYALRAQDWDRVDPTLKTFDKMPI
ncbi:MAG: GFA family protein [Asticcacaulis sp.]